MIEIDERGWYNEWDIPLDVFNQAIDDIVEIYNWYSERLDQDYTEQLRMLKELKEFRNKDE